MANQYKAEVACVMCDQVAHDAIKFPCECLSCKVHLRENKVKNNKITCPKCQKDFHVSNKEDFMAPQKIVKNILNKESYLSSDEKGFKGECNSFSRSI